MRKYFPWIPVIGIFLTLAYHIKYGDVLNRENNPFGFILSAILQGIYIAGLLILLLI